jgi:hypothetical protein
MTSYRRLPALPYVLLGAMSLISFGGPFVILFIVRGGASANWPPDRPVEWITIALVLLLAIALFLACVSIGWWYPSVRHVASTQDGITPSRPNRE